MSEPIIEEFDFYAELSKQIKSKSRGIEVIYACPCGFIGKLFIAEYECPVCHEKLFFNKRTRRLERRSLD